MDIQNLKVGDKFYLFRELHHYLCMVNLPDTKLHIYKKYNKYSRRWVYIAKPQELFEIDLEYAHKRRIEDKTYQPIKDQK